jgi:G3E family GTPase
MLLSQVSHRLPSLWGFESNWNRDTGVNAIESLMSKKGAFDYILLETTGLADPGNIAPLFWVDEGLGSSIYLDGIVTLVDAKNILHSLEDPSGKLEGHDDNHGPLMTTAHVQISHADVVVINKSDLVSKAELDLVKSRIESINGLARLHVTEKSIVPQLEGFLLDLHAYDQLNEVDFAKKGHSHLDPVSGSRRLNREQGAKLILADNINHLNPCRNSSS